MVAASAVAAVGCSDQREQAANELQRLNEAMQQHATEYGSFPSTLDADRPASAANLPYAGERKVTVRLVGVTSDGYAATARRGVWLCGVHVEREQKAVPDCTPTGTEPTEPAEDVPPSDNLERILDGSPAAADPITEPEA